MKYRVVKSVFLLYALLASVLTFATELPGVSDPSGQEEPVSAPETLTQSEVGDFVAPLDEQQVRALLIEKLENEAALSQSVDQSENISVIEMLKGIRNPYTPLGGAVEAAINSADTYFERVGEIVNRLTGGRGVQGLLFILGLLTIVSLLSYAVEYLVLLKPRKLQLATRDTGEQSFRRNFGNPLLVFLMNFTGLVLFSIAGYVIAAVLVEEDSNEYQLMMTVFDWIIAVRFFILLYRLLFRQPPRGFGLIDKAIDAPKLHTCLVIFTFNYIFSTGLIDLFAQNGFSSQHVILSLLFMGVFLLNFIVIWFVWTQRYDIDRILFGSTDEPLEYVTHRYKARAVIWPSVVTFVLVIGVINWAIQLLLENERGLQAITVAWWVTLLFPLIDLVVTSLLNNLVSLEIFQHKRFQQRKQRFICVIRSVVRLVLITLLILSMLEAWGFDLLEEYRTVAGRDIVQTMLDIGVVVLIGYVLWEVIQLWMERKLPDEPEDALAEIEAEGGGAAATRTETLLPLFKTTLMVVLFLMVIMSVLYSLGIQIGPLLAGAGVVGIAVGFGSQKLVQDIISGVFFLIDDAFRKGEYVEVAGMRGTVEKLSVRSMRLRHHLGAVQTIPYGEIATVRNLSRDWVIMKLELRLPYDVDIEKVRKVIKKVGQEMMQDEEIGPNMLQPLKSQGVMRVEESALIIRMKFTAKPGEQWIIRRVAYTKVRDALSAAGIEFAHREVKVRLPTELENLQKLDYERKLHLENGQPEPTVEDANTKSATIAAAAMSAVVAKELAAHEKIDQDSDEGDDR